MTIDDLAAECDVDRRTIHRDLKAVEEAGYTLTSEWQDNKKVYSFLTRSKNIQPITFTLNQLLTLYLLRSSGSYLSGTPFQAEIDELFQGINSALPDRLAAHMERITSVSLPLLHGVRDYSKASAHVAELRRALLLQLGVKLIYAKKGSKETAEYILDPYTLVFHKEGIYLLGYVHNRSGMRLFALERIRGIDVTRHRFEIPQKYSPEEHFSKAFGLVSGVPMRVRVRFSGDVAHTVQERIWMSGQKIETEKDGSVILEFEATGEMEIVSWILSYGTHAEVLGPPELRRKIKLQIREMREFYRNRGKQ
jgi:proteasome accessory factor B